MEALQALSLGPWRALLMIFTLPQFYPVLAALDFGAHAGPDEAPMLWIAAILALVLQTSFLTPPLGFALFFLKGSAPPSVTLGDI